MRSLLLGTLSLWAFASTASELVNGATVSGAITTPGLHDSYSFSAGAGESFAIVVQETSGAGFQALLQVYDPNGTRLTGFTNDSWFATATVGGTYTVLVLDSNDAQAGTYNLSFALAPGASENGTLAIGTTISDALDPGDLDSFGFDLEVGDSFAVAVQETSGAGFQALLQVYDPNGTRLITLFTNDSWFATATAGGTYTVLVFDNDAEHPGNYNLSFAKAPGETELGTLANGATYSGDCGPGDIDSFSFDAAIGESFAIVVQETSGAGFQALLQVYDPNGTRLITLFTNDSWFATATVGGTYTVLVFDNDAEHPGNYNLSFAKAPGANSGGALADGTVVAGSIVPGGLDSFTFGVSVGESFSIAVSKTSGAALFHPLLQIYDPNGTRLTGFTNFSWFATATVGGTYTVLVLDNDAEQSGTYELLFDLSNEVLSYAALGDSYSAGESVWPYFDPTDTWNTGRHQSTRAYSTKLRVPGTSQAIAARSDAEFDFYACTGARSFNIKRDGEDCGEHPTQLTPANQVDASRDLVTISVGGNDAQFPSILQFCMAHNACNELRPLDPHSNVELGELMYAVALHAGIRQLETFQEIKAATPNAPTIVFGYPILLGGVECPAASVPFAVDAKFSTAEQAWMRDINAFMNGVTAQAAALAGVHFVPVADRFEGHGVCGPLDDWINGFLPFDPYGSFHPTARGQQAYADAGNAYLESIRAGWAPGYFSTGLPRNPPPTILFPEIDLGGAVPANAPAFGELFVELATAPIGCEAARSIIVPAQDARVMGAGFAPLESVAIDLVINDQSSLLATVAADMNGDLDATVSIPSGLAIGLAGNVEATGAGAGGGGLLLIAQVVTVTSISFDADSDGFPDGCDNCSSTANADQLDQDLDGRGDVCDACPTEFIDDADGDGQCAGVDACPLDPLNDADGDGLCADLDNCAITSNASQADADGDGIGDACEALACYNTTISVSSVGAGSVASTPVNCGFGSGHFGGTVLELVAIPLGGLTFTGWTGTIAGTSNPLNLTVDSDMTLVANFCASTADGDGDLVADACDNCPTVSDADQTDTDSDGQGNPCDADDDGDGFSDAAELAGGTDPLDPSSHPPVAVPLGGLLTQVVTCLALLALVRGRLRKRNEAIGA
jgi:lysophospholipase L1-like esterase